MFALRDVRAAVADAPNAIDLNAARRLSNGSADVNHNDNDNAAAPSISFNNVSFGYHPDRQILNGLTLDVPAGKTVGVVGASGCGKSTLLRVLFRFYDVDQGSITIDGIDVRQATLSSVRKNIGVVPQDVILFNESIAYNILYGDLTKTHEDVVVAAKAAKIHESIVRMPDGYDTVVGERGVKLSGGEKQRVAIGKCSAFLHQQTKKKKDFVCSKISSEQTTLASEKNTFLRVHSVLTNPN
jgi:ABC-type transport system involved in Fe-S cluster assembly fused permease/ATPase subunit